MGSTLAILSRKAGPLEYEATLELIVNELSQIDDDDKSDMKETIQTLTFILCNSPEGTLLFSQRCLSRVLSQAVIWVKDEGKQVRSNKKTYETSVFSLQMVEALLSSKVNLLPRGKDIYNLLIFVFSLYTAYSIPKWRYQHLFCLGCFKSKGILGVRLQHQEEDERAKGDRLV